MSNVVEAMRSRVAAVGLMTLGALALLVGPAAAQESGLDAVESAVTSAASDASGIITFGIPVVLGVAALWVALRFGKSLLSKI